MEKRGYVYFMSNKKQGVIYIGVTSDLRKRVWEHKEHVVEGFTKRYNLDKLVYYEIHDTVVSAIEQEKKLKNVHRKKKIEIIERDNPSWRDLYADIL